MKNINKAAFIFMILGLMFVLISCSNTSKREPYNEEIHPALSVQNSLSRAQDNALNDVQKLKVENSISLKSQYKSIDEINARYNTFMRVMIGILVVFVILALLMVWSMYDDRVSDILYKIGIAKFIIWIDKKQQEKKAKESSISRGTKEKIKGIAAFVLVVLLFKGCQAMGSSYGNESSIGSSSGTAKASICKVCDREFTDSSNIKCIRETNMCKNCYNNYSWATGETPTKY